MIENIIKNKNIIDTSLFRIGSIYKIYNDSDNIFAGLLVTAEPEYLGFISAFDEKYNYSKILHLRELEKGGYRIEIYKDFSEWFFELFEQTR